MQGVSHHPALPAGAEPAQGAAAYLISVEQQDAADLRVRRVAFAPPKCAGFRAIAAV